MVLAEASLTSVPSQAAALVERLRRVERDYRSLIGNEPTVPSSTAGEAAALITSLDAELAELRRERDALRLEAQGHASEARTANATIYEAYQAVTGSTGEPGNWNGAEPIKAELSRLRALVAEAVRVCEPFAKRAGKLNCRWLDHETNWSPAYGLTEITIGHLRAARNFVERAKES